MGIDVTSQVFYGVKVDIGDRETFYEAWGEEPTSNGIKVMICGGDGWSGKLEYYAIIYTTRRVLYDGSPEPKDFLIPTDVDLADKDMDIVCELEKWGIQSVGEFGWHATTTIM